MRNITTDDAVLYSGEKTSETEMHKTRRKAIPFDSAEVYVHKQLNPQKANGCIEAKSFQISGRKSKEYFGEVYLIRLIYRVTYNKPPKKLYRKCDTKWCCNIQHYTEDSSQITINQAKTLLRLEIKEIKTAEFWKLDKEGLIKWDLSRDPVFIDENNKRYRVRLV